ncbi:exonuclease domain-containing protein [Calidifontibacter terrae]
MLTDSRAEQVAARYPLRYAVLDVETSGLDARQHRVLQIAITQLDAHGVAQQSWASLVQPGAIDLGPLDVHGITPERLADAPSYGEIADRIDALIRDRVVVAHNAPFDWAFLAAEHRRLGRRLPTRQRLCTLELSRRLHTPAATYSLESLSAYWQVVQSRPHDAEDDVRVLVEVFRHALAAADEAGAELPVRDPYARVPFRRRIRRRWRKLRWKIRRRVKKSDARVR